MPQCEAETAHGAQCQRAATPGSEPPRCAVHLGLPVGGESTLTDEVQTRLADLLRAGNYVDVACAAAGVARQTFYAWMKRGERAAEDDVDDEVEQPYREFREAIQLARAEGEATLVTLIAKAARTDWKAAAWILERHGAERWERPSQRQHLEPTGGGAPAPVDPTESDPFEELDELAPRREAREAGRG